MVATSLVVSLVLVAQSGDYGERYGGAESNSSDQVHQPLIPTNRNPSTQGMTPITPIPSNLSSRSGREASTSGSDSTPRSSLQSSPPLRSNAAGTAYGADPRGNPVAPLRTASSSTDRESPAAKMMRSMLTPPSGAQLTGRRVTLEEVVGGASSRSEQTVRVDAYWDLCSAVADYYLGLREQQELQQGRSVVNQVGRAWQQAEAEMRVRIGTSLRAAIASQHRLASLMGRSGLSQLPLPDDMPHTGDYYTRFDQVFAGRRSVEAEQLKELLPLRYEELQAATVSVTEAEEWLRMVAQRISRDSDGEGIVKSLELLALRRRAFVQIAKDYNRRIARYTELAAPGRVSTERLVAMLVKRDEKTSTAARPDGSSQTGDSPPRGRQSQTDPAGPPQTFAGEWAPRGEQPLRVDDNLELASGAQPRDVRRQERSVLVNPL